MCLFLNSHVKVGTLLNPLHFMGVNFRFYKHHLLFCNQWRVTRSTWMLYVMLCLWCYCRSLRAKYNLEVESGSDIQTCVLMFFDEKYI
uniref:Uncharacterized protein n=1 Tax=Brassica oleracea TaxID=3712 RepID=A0A3P6FAV3_BRAOL|nr:unnamed protein product [Brassica oleracea]VDD54898.1 unnamed protein product [Brassica oleracea]